MYKGTLRDRNFENPQTVTVKSVHGETFDFGFKPKYGYTIMNIYLNVKYEHYILGHDYTGEDVDTFLAEVLQMRGFQHFNVLSMLGFVIRDNKPYAILPYMTNGDLKTYIVDPHNVSLNIKYPSHSLSLKCLTFYVRKQWFNMPEGVCEYLIYNLQKTLKKLSNPLKVTYIYA